MFDINCKVNGVPTPDYTWFKDGYPYTKGKVIGNALHVSKAEKRDNGIFWCSATNRAGTTIDYIEVKVAGASSSSFFWLFITFFAFVVVGIVVSLLWKLFGQKDLKPSEL